jgi:hypothetical protein
VLKILPWVLFGLSCLVVGWLAIMLLNAGVALDNSRSQAIFLKDRSELALTIIRRDWTGVERSRVSKLSENLQREGAIVGVEGDSIKIGDFIFVTDKGLVKSVQYLK